MRIGIAGVGGIGSNVAVNLVRGGIDWLRLVDFDRVEPSNLNRQYYFHDQIGRLKVEALAENLGRIRPGLIIEAVVEQITRENCRRLFAGCDLIVEGLDRATDKKMLFETLAGKRPLVSACGIAGAELADIHVRRFNNCLVAGDFRTDCDQAPLFAHKVSTVANHMTAILFQEIANHAHSR